jgi:AhpD family alkylhydroperoxidase
MNREEVFSEIQEMMGTVPTLFKNIPEDILAPEWETFKAVQMTERHIPGKYKEMMGLALAAATRCRYCMYFHQKFAKLFGATDEEIQEMMHYAKSSMGWSTYINGTQQPYDEFCREIDQVVAHAEKMMSEGAHG